uniref:Integrase catalytic region n=1 Tax=Streptomyces muensis TaxID=1077944 RepID=A0A0E3Z7N5_STRM4|nr:integrase catalytic region [Streptomyces muensis]
MASLGAYHLTGSHRAAAELAGVDHHTVARYVKLREAGERPAERQHRARPIDEFMDKIEELLTASKGRIGADIVHRRITAAGLTGGDRTTRRAVVKVKARMRSRHHRVPSSSPPAQPPQIPYRGSDEELAQGLAGQNAHGLRPGGSGSFLPSAHWNRAAGRRRSKTYFSPSVSSGSAPTISKAPTHT